VIGAAKDDHEHVVLLQDAAGAGGGGDDDDDDDDGNDVDRHGDGANVMVTEDGMVDLGVFANGISAGLQEEFDFGGQDEYEGLAGFDDDDDDNADDGDQMETKDEDQEVEEERRRLVGATTSVDPTGDTTTMGMSMLRGLFAGNQKVPDGNAWAGMGHWRYRRPAAVGHADAATNIDETTTTTTTTTAAAATSGGTGDKGSGGSRRKTPTIDFEHLPAIDEARGARLVELPKTKAAIRLAAKPRPVQTLLPEDQHYEPSALARPFLISDRFAADLIARVHRLGLAKAQRATGAEPGTDDDTTTAAGHGGVGGQNLGWDDEDGNDEDEIGTGGMYDWDHDLGSLEDGRTAAADGETAHTAGGSSGKLIGENELVRASRQVIVDQVNYARQSKTVDVRALKHILWTETLRDVQVSGQRDQPLEMRAVQFKDVIKAVPDTSQAGRLEDVSVHLAFICMLHLANENGLVIKGVDSLDDLQISSIPTV